MPESNFFRRIEEKNLSCEVELMQWSPKMDLIALSLSSGEVALHRLSWQKVWTLRAREDVADARVTALAWRPDGKILAVGYDSGVVVLVDVEDANIVHENQFKGCGGLDLSHGSNVASAQIDPLSPPPDVAVRCLNWIEVSPTADDDSVDELSGFFKDEGSAAGASEGAFNLSSENELLRDDADKFLQKLPSLAKNQGNLATKKEAPPENVEDNKKIKDQTGLNVLTVGFGRNMIQLFAFGLCPMGNKEIELASNDNSFPNQKVTGIIEAYLSQDLRSLTVVAETSYVENSAVLSSHRLYVYDTSVLVRHHREIRVLAQRYGQVLALQEYMDGTLKLMKEAWEDILQDMDDKLLMFAEEKRRSGGGSLGVDFLELLLYGIASDELNNFLLHNLTAKGLKKLAHSIESSYINIQKLVLKNLQTVCQSLVYHLSDLHGMSKWEDRFGQLGLEKDACLTTLLVAGGCFLKACDLQQAIDSSLKNFKAFFSWLYVAIQRLSDEAVPAELGKMSMSDINFVAEFLKENFCYDLEDESKSPASAAKGEVKGRFRLERVGQYLKDEPLSFPTPEKNSIWGVFLDHLDAAEASRVMASPLIFPSFASHSILTLNERLLDSFYNALMVPGIKIGSWFSLTSAVDLYSPSKPSFKPLFCYWSDPSHRQHYLAFKSPVGNSMSVLQRSTGSPMSSYSFVCVKFRFMPSDSPASPVSSLSSSSSSAMEISDIQAYDRDSLTLLLHEPKSDGGPFLRQFYTKEVENLLLSPDSTLVHCELPVAPGTMPILAFNIPNAIASTTTLGGVNALVNANESFTTKRLNNLKSEAIAVSGSRKVCCVLFTSKRRVSLFLTDVLDEEEEEEEEEETKEDEDEENDGEEKEEVEQEVGEGDSTVEEGEEEMGMVGNLELNVDEGDRESDKENDLV